ncbi:RICIN domain-containing protein [Streptomyces sp. NPDC057702]|uniref:RICIN domain-containing protein n=1 Tax=unclassified Streptomyces TaxID=2593676 RepID=UPI0036A42A34
MTGRPGGDEAHAPTAAPAAASTTGATTSAAPTAGAVERPAVPDGTPATADSSTTASPVTTSSSTASATAGGAPAEPLAATVAAGASPTGRPHRQLLAGAAIAGTVLIGLPLLFLGLGEDDKKADSVAVARDASDTVLRDEGPDRQHPGGYAPASPSAAPSPKATRASSPPRAERSTPPTSPTIRPEQPHHQPATRERAEPHTTPGPRAKPSSTPRPKKSPRVHRGTGLPQGPNFDTVKGVVLKNTMTRMCADVPGYGMGTLNGPVNQFTCDGSDRDNQRWDLVVGQRDGGPGGADLFTIRNSGDGYCLDLPDYGAKPSRTPVYQWHCNPGPHDNQMWYLDKKADGAFWIRNRASRNMCLDVGGFYGSGGRDARLTIFECDLRDDHLWSFA